MNYLQSLQSKVQLAEDVFIAPNATLLGPVTLGRQSSVWFGAVLRADSDTITIGQGTNIQDNAVIHVDPGMPVAIGDYCTIGHLALVHGATIGNNCLIGMHSTILNGAVIGNNCIIGANALVKEGMIIPDGSMVLGVPAKIVKTLDEAAFLRILKNAEAYIALSERYRG